MDPNAPTSPFKNHHHNKNQNKNNQHPHNNNDSNSNTNSHSQSHPQSKQHQRQHKFYHDAASSSHGGNVGLGGSSHAAAGGTTSGQLQHAYHQQLQQHSSASQGGAQQPHPQRQPHDAYYQAYTPQQQQLQQLHHPGFHLQPSLLGSAGGTIPASPTLEQHQRFLNLSHQAAIGTAAHGHGSANRQGSDEALAVAGHGQPAFQHAAAAQKAALQALYAANKSRDTKKRSRVDNTNVNVNQGQGASQSTTSIRGGHHPHQPQQQPQHSINYFDPQQQLKQHQHGHAASAYYGQFSNASASSSATGGSSRASPVVQTQPSTMAFQPPQPQPQPQQPHGQQQKHHVTGTVHPHHYNYGHDYTHAASKPHRGKGLPVGQVSGSKHSPRPSEHMQQQQSMSMLPPQGQGQVMDAATMQYHQAAMVVAAQLQAEATGTAPSSSAATPINNSSGLTQQQMASMMASMQTPHGHGLMMQQLQRQHHPPSATGSAETTPAAGGAGVSSIGKGSGSAKSKGKSSMKGKGGKRARSSPSKKKAGAMVTASASTSAADGSGVGVANQLVAGGQAGTDTDTSLSLGTGTSTPSMAPSSAKVVRKKPGSGKEKGSGRKKGSSVQGKGSGKKTRTKKDETQMPQQQSSPQTAEEMSLMSQQSALTADINVLPVRKKKKTEKAPKVSVPPGSTSTSMRPPVSRPVKQLPPRPGPSEEKVAKPKKGKKQNKLVKKDDDADAQEETKAQRDKADVNESEKPKEEEEAEAEEEEEEEEIPMIPLEISEMVNYQTRNHHHTNPLLTTPPFPGLITQWPAPGTASSAKNGGAASILSRMTPLEYYHQLYRQFCPEDAAPNPEAPTTHTIQNVQFNDAPHASELWSIVQVYFATQSNVFPLRYYANVLGFDLVERSKSKAEDEAAKDKSSTTMIVNKNNGHDTEKEETEKDIVTEEATDIDTTTKDSMPTVPQTKTVPQALKEDSHSNDATTATATTTKQSDDAPSAKSENVRVFSDAEQALKHLLEEEYELQLLTLPESNQFLQVPAIGNLSSAGVSASSTSISTSIPPTRMDPIFATLVTFFDGYTEESFRKGISMSSKNIARVLSRDCLAMAKELGLQQTHAQTQTYQPSELTSRFATMADVSAVYKLFHSSSKKKKHRSLLRPEYKQFTSETDVFNLLRSATDFIVLVQDSVTQEIKGGIHYCFHWYRHESLSGENGQALSELVCFVNQLVVVMDDDEDAAGDAANNNKKSVGTCICPVLLINLALEHARINGIMYVTTVALTSPNRDDDERRRLSAFQMLERYFRADRAGQSRTQKRQKKAVPLVLDLLKVGYRYSFLLLRQDVQQASKDADATSSKQPADADDDVAVKERLLLRLPSRESATMTLAAGFGDRSSTTGPGRVVSGALATTRSDRQGAEQYQSTNAASLAKPTTSSAKASLRDKTVHVRVELPNDDSNVNSNVTSNVNNNSNVAEKTVDISSSSEETSDITKQALQGMKLYRPQTKDDDDGDAAAAVTEAANKDTDETVSEFEEMGVPPINSMDNLFVPGWDVLRRISVPAASSTKQVSVAKADGGEILQELMEKQRELHALEQEVLRPKLEKVWEQVAKERVLFESKHQQARKRQGLGPTDVPKDEDELALKDYETLMIRKKEEAAAWQHQLEQDMDAVCDICNDGEVSQKNQILFCESCNVAVHQGCYGIDSIPAGDYFCHACRYYGRDTKSSKQVNKGPLPIMCELCPRKNGAFVRTENGIVVPGDTAGAGSISTPTTIPTATATKRKPGRSSRKSNDTAITPAATPAKQPQPHTLKPRWVHVVCAKWQGLDYVDKQTRDCVQSVAEIKKYFLDHEISCQICEGMRGACNKCSKIDCENYLHMSCARSVGTCKVNHGETYEGLLDTPEAWTLSCPQHSHIAPEDVPDDAVPQEKLIELSKSLPPDVVDEPPPPPPPPPPPTPPPPLPSPPKKEKVVKPKKEKPRNKFFLMNREERTKWLADQDYEAHFNEMMVKRRDGAFCAVCNMREEASGRGGGGGGAKNKQEKGGGDDDIKEVDVGLMQCVGCNLMVHKDCYVSKDNQGANEALLTMTTTQKDGDSRISKSKAFEFACDACRWVEEQKAEGKAAAAAVQEASEGQSQGPEEGQLVPLSLPPPSDIEVETPACNMCNQRGGPLRKAFANPTSMGKWKKDPRGYKRSLFGKQIWCHLSCGIWHPLVDICKANKFNMYEDTFDCTMIIMSNGMGHIKNKEFCLLCGRNDKVKVACLLPDCRVGGGACASEAASDNSGEKEKEKMIDGSKRKVKDQPYRFHVTCARQAGLHVLDRNEDGDTYFDLKCYNHMDCEFVFRARLEDLLEIEKTRKGQRLQLQSKPVPLSHASRVHHFAVLVLQQLGWAWRWAEWWVAYGDNWEPLLEPDQNEAEMTQEELRVVHSTPESRADDARKCRLQAFGAALRNRDYDALDYKDGCAALDRALRAVLHIPSLVGPLLENEIDFFADCLGRAYRSKDPLLGFGDKDQIKVATASECPLTHFLQDGSPKYKLGARPLPGLQVLSALPSEGGDEEEKEGREVEVPIFESGIDEPDDYLKLALVEDATCWDTNGNGKKSSANSGNRGGSGTGNGSGGAAANYNKKRKRHTPDDDSNIVGGGTAAVDDPPRRTSRRRSTTPPSALASPLPLEADKDVPPVTTVISHKSKDGVSGVPLPDTETGRKNVLVNVKVCTEDDIVSCTEDEASVRSRSGSNETLTVTDGDAGPSPSTAPSTPVKQLSTNTTQEGDVRTSNLSSQKKKKAPKLKLPTLTPSGKRRGRPPSAAKARLQKIAEQEAAEAEAAAAADAQEKEASKEGDAVIAEETAVASTENSAEAATSSTEAEAAADTDQPDETKDNDTPAINVNVNVNVKTEENAGVAQEEETEEANTKTAKFEALSPAGSNKNDDDDDEPIVKQLRRRGRPSSTSTAKAKKSKGKKTKKEDDAAEEAVPSTPSTPDVAPRPRRALRSRRPPAGSMKEDPDEDGIDDDPKDKRDNDSDKYDDIDSPFQSAKEEDDADGDDAEVSMDEEDVTKDDEAEKTPPKRRGRPPSKNKAKKKILVGKRGRAATTGAAKVKRERPVRRGRPPRGSLKEEEVEEEGGEAEAKDAAEVFGDESTSASEAESVVEEGPPQKKNQTRSRSGSRTTIERRRQPVQRGRDRGRGRPSAAANHDDGDDDDDEEFDVDSSASEREENATTTKPKTTTTSRRGRLRSRSHSHSRATSAASEHNKEGEGATVGGGGVVDGKDDDTIKKHEEDDIDKQAEALAAAQEEQSENMRQAESFRIPRKKKGVTPPK
jgi:hypothetical protein